MDSYDKYEINVISNRCSNVFFQACIRFNTFLKENDNPNYRQRIKQNNTLLYWWNPGDKPISIFSLDKIIQNMHNRTVGYLFNKKTCSNKIRELNITNYHPPTYNNINDIKNIKDHNIWFVKQIDSANGQGVKCLSSSELKEYNLTNNEIVQEGITNIKLLNNKKFIVRIYVIIFNNKIYMSKHSYCAIFNNNFDKDKIDHNVQVCYPKDRHFKSLGNTQYSSYIYKIRDAIKDMKPLFEQAAEHSKNKYTILGPDVIITDDDQIKIIEVNTVPGLNHDKNINEKVHINMIFDLYKLVFLDSISETLFEIN